MPSLPVVVEASSFQHKQGQLGTAEMSHVGHDIGAGHPIFHSRCDSVAARASRAEGRAERDAGGSARESELLVYRTERLLLYNIRGGGRLAVPCRGPPPEPALRVLSARVATPSCARVCLWPRASCHITYVYNITSHRHRHPRPHHHQPSLPPSSSHHTTS